ncbi:hypothetical protein [Amycolatopsis sp. cmx-11-12]|uniref:hypothetical protein n=1 Tax=Amycolatopsis sp. cmx-11-12 TaxID=2785795 RepID=UPI00391808A1
MLDHDHDTGLCRGALCDGSNSADRRDLHLAGYRRTRPRPRSTGPSPAPTPDADGQIQGR